MLKQAAGPEEELVDLDSKQGVALQLLRLGGRRDEYLDWQERHIATTLRLLPWDWAEAALTKTRWWVVPLLWVPVAAWLINYYVTQASKASVGQLAASVSFGILLWTLIEYTLHRFVFHWDRHLPNNGFAIAFHFLLHGCHHKAPLDSLRLVMPPAVAASLMALIFAVMRGLVFTEGRMSLPVFCATYAGGLLGYVCYDMTHYATHHLHLSKKAKGCVPAGRWFAFLQTYHQKHHVIHHRGFGVSSPLWDIVFNTGYPTQRHQQRQPSATKGE